MRYVVLAGIIAYDSPIGEALYGCINDVNDMSAYLQTLGYPASVPLTDRNATTDAIRRALGTAVGSMGSGDELIFFFSGHGTPFLVGGLRHDAICPADFDWSPQHTITDDDLAAIIAPVNRSARITIIVDACYSGGLTQNYLDIIKPVFRVKRIPPPPRLGREIAAAENRGRVRTFADALCTAPAVLLSACTANEMAGDRDFDHANGVLTHYLLMELRANPRVSAATTVANVVTSIHTAGFPQTPELHGMTSLFNMPLVT